MTVQSSPDLAHDADVEAWHHLDVHCLPALARTHVRLTGVLDRSVVEEIDRAAEAATDNAHALTLDLTGITAIAASVLDELCIRGYRPRETARPDTPAPPPPIHRHVITCRP